MSLPSVSPDMLNAGTNRFLARLIPTLGISLSEMDYLRGHPDDFFGDWIQDEYDITDFAGALSVAPLLLAGHGGWVIMTSGPGAARYSALWLGDKADGYATLNADPGWVMLGRLEISATTNITTYMGTANAARNRRITVRANTAVGANWYLVCQNAAGTTTTDSGIATDTDPHWHAIVASVDQVDYYLDGALIATGTANIHNAILTPMVECRSPAGNLRTLSLDYWNPIPRN